jgi:hypothetical protein
MSRKQKTKANFNWCFSVVSLNAKIQKSNLKLYWPQAPIRLSSFCNLLNDILLSAIAVD